MHSPQGRSPVGRREIALAIEAYAVKSREANLRANNSCNSLRMLDLQSHNSEHVGQTDTEYPNCKSSILRIERIYHVMLGIRSVAFFANEDRVRSGTDPCPVPIPDQTLPCSALLCPARLCPALPYIACSCLVTSCVLLSCVLLSLWRPPRGDTPGDPEPPGPYALDPPKFPKFDTRHPCQITCARVSKGGILYRLWDDTVNIRQFPAIVRPQRTIPLKLQTSTEKL